MRKNKMFATFIVGGALSALVVAGCEEGSLQGEGQGHGDEPIVVEVQVGEGDEIESVNVISHDDSEDVSEQAFQEIPQNIVDSNSTDVDVISGATRTSEGIMEAVENALN